MVLSVAKRKLAMSTAATIRNQTRPWAVRGGEIGVSSWGLSLLGRGMGPFSVEEVSGEVGISVGAVS
jgi:hypothetical protein